VRLDDTPVAGLPENIGYIDLRTHSVEQLVRLVERKLGPVRHPEDPGQLLGEAVREDVLRLTQTSNNPDTLEMARLVLAQLVLEHA
jgi:hypothetical protein